MSKKTPSKGPHAQATRNIDQSVSVGCTMPLDKAVKQWPEGSYRVIEIDEDYQTTEVHKPLEELVKTTDVKESDTDKKAERSGKKPAGK